MAIPQPLLLSKCNVVVLPNFCFTSLADLSWHPACNLLPAWLLFAWFTSFICFSKALLLCSTVLDKSKFCSILLPLSTSGERRFLFISEQVRYSCKSSCVSLNPSQSFGWIFVHFKIYSLFFILKFTVSWCRRSVVMRQLLPPFCS